MTTLAPGMPPLPDRFLGLPLDHRGYPVPKFCLRKPDGTFDFRVVQPGWRERCVRNKLCWLCGEKIGKFMCFVIGPMCAINRNTSEPPCHRECAEFAVQACPFMRFPNRKRNDEDMPDERIKPGGDESMIMRNPGVSLLWITKSYKTYQTHEGFLIEIGDPVETAWWAHGRAATHDEIMASINSGLPILWEMAEREGPDAVLALTECIDAGMKLVPA